MSRRAWWMLVCAVMGGRLAFGGVAHDGKAGPAMTVLPVNGVYDIPAGSGKRIGSNLLLHSFSQFSIGRSQIATFTGPDAISNVVARVTGPSQSSIDGTIRCGIPNASFYLINPNGVVFGPDARVEVGGSFVVSTADYVRLSNGMRLDPALADKVSPLTSVAPAAFGFLKPGGAVRVEGTLSVNAGRTIAAIGGPVRIAGGKLYAWDGRVNLISIKDKGEATAPVDDLSAPASIGGASGGNINIEPTSQVDVSGDGGGRISVLGGRFSLTNSAMYANALGNGVGQGIDIHVDRLSLARGALIGVSAQSGFGSAGTMDINAAAVAMKAGYLYAAALQNSTGAGGTLNLRAGSVDLANSSGISTTSVGPGTAGDMAIHVTRTFRVTGYSFVSSQAQGAGHGGNISLAAGTLNIFGPQVQYITGIESGSSGAGDAGTLRVRAGTISLGQGGQIRALTTGSGDGGDIHVNAQRVVMRAPMAMGSSAITASSYGDGAAGNIWIDASSLDLLQNGLVLADTAGTGAGGDVRIHAGSLRLLANGLISSDTLGSGAGGNVLVVTDHLIMDGESRGLATEISAQARNKSIIQQASGNAGDVVVRTGSLQMSNYSGITSQNQGTGRGGDVTVTVTGDVRIGEQAGLTVGAEQNHAGTIRVSAGHRIELAGAKITATARRGDGGNISLSAADRIFAEHSEIRGFARDSGGNITLHSPAIGLVSSTINGIVQRAQTPDVYVAVQSPAFIRSFDTRILTDNFSLPPSLDIAGSLVPLPDYSLGGRLALLEECGIRLGGFSSFVILGRGGTPIEPGGWIPSIELRLGEGR